MFFQISCLLGKCRSECTKVARTAGGLAMNLFFGWKSPLSNGERTIEKKSYTIERGGWVVG